MSEPILGDNIFLRDALLGAFQRRFSCGTGARDPGMSHVQDPEHYGVVEFDQTGLARSIEEKPHALVELGRSRSL